MKPSSFFSLTVLSILLGVLPTASAQTTVPVNSVMTATTEASGERSVEARTRYEAQMKTLRAQMDAQQWQEALATVEALQAQRPREPQARFLKTIVLTELGRNDEAQADLLSLVADFPELPEPHNNLATLYAKKGQYDLAQRELELALTAVPDYAIAHANLADLYLQQAVQHYQQAAALMASHKDKESKALLTRAGTIQTLLVSPADKKAEKPAGVVEGKTEAAKEESSFLSAGCAAPPGLGEEGGDERALFAAGGCDVDFDESAEGSDAKPESAKGK